MKTWLIALALACTLVIACGGEPEADLPRATESGAPGAAGAPGELGAGLDFSAIQAQARLVIISRQLVARGHQCGWHAGWMRTIKHARGEEPSAFRGDAIGSAFTFGLVALVAGVAATLFLAWLLPRLARRKAKAESATRHADEARGTGLAPTPPGWLTYFKDLGVRFLQRLGRLLHVELFDPVLASQRTQAIHTARDAERQLAVAIDAATRLVPAPPEGDAPEPSPTPGPSTAARDVKLVLESWRGELQVLRKKLEAPGALPRELAVDALMPRLDNIRRMTRDVRVGLERALVASAGRPLDEGAWHVWQQRLAERPRTPHEQAATAALLAPWVRPLGLGGLAGVALAIPLIAAWMAAGAFPLFLAFLIAAGGLGSVLVARVHLHRAGGLTLLPGFADRVARWLVSVCTLAFALMLVSSWMSSESGLDLGDPPPVPVPDPAALEAPELWPTRKNP